MAPIALCPSPIYPSIHLSIKSSIHPSIRPITNPSILLSILSSTPLLTPGKAVHCTQWLLCVCVCVRYVSSSKNKNKKTKVIHWIYTLIWPMGCQRRGCLNQSAVPNQTHLRPQLSTICFFAEVHSFLFVTSNCYVSLCCFSLSRSHYPPVTFPQ